MPVKRKFLAKVVLSFASFSFHIKENEEVNQSEAQP